MILWFRHISPGLFLFVPSGLQWLCKIEWWSSIHHNFFTLCSWKIFTNSIYCNPPWCMESKWKSLLISFSTSLDIFVRSWQFGLTVNPFSHVNDSPVMSSCFSDALSMFSFLKFLCYVGGSDFNMWHRNTGPEGWRLRQRHFETVTSLVRSCRRFFPRGSAYEIWSEFK